MTDSNSSMKSRTLILFVTERENRKLKADFQEANDEVAPGKKEIGSLQHNLSALEEKCNKTKGARRKDFNSRMLRSK